MAGSTWETRIGSARRPPSFVPACNYYTGGTFFGAPCRSVPSTSIVDAFGVGLSIAQSAHVLWSFVSLSTRKIPCGSSFSSPARLVVSGYQVHMSFHVPSTRQRAEWAVVDQARQIQTCMIRARLNIRMRACSGPSVVAQAVAQVVYNNLPTPGVGIALGSPVSCCSTLLSCSGIP